MSDYVIRKAEVKDVDQISKHLKDFQEHYGSKHKLYPGEKKARIALINLISQQYFMVALNKNSDIIGLIAGCLSPHAFNDELKVFHELFWWVQKEYRQEKVGMELLDQCIAFARSKADWVIFGLGPNSTVPRDLFLSKGFREDEQFFLMEV